METIKQLSVFLENKGGRINDVAKALGEHGINMHAFSMAETTDFGILRLIVSDVEQAVDVLRAENFAVVLTDVVCISCPNVAGALSAILERLAEHQVFIEYMYAFAQGEKANIVIRPSNLEECLKWLEEEDYILKSPMRRIHKIRTKTVVKETISDEDIEKLRDHCSELRDVAMIDLLYSTGIRVGELVNLDIKDVNFEQRECVVFGKGDKERRVYFDAKAKIHLKRYLASRTDNNPALFVTLGAPHNRLKISGVEIRIRELGRSLGMSRIHPHKFRRTMATRAIDKGMPIEQVQKILGHSQIDTTMQYAIVNQNNVKNAHQKYIS